MKTIKEFYNKARIDLSLVYSKEEANSIADLYFCHIFNYSKTNLILNFDKELNSQEIKILEIGIKRLLQMEPVQYIIGEAHFYDLIFRVNKNVLIPRQETELLVHEFIKQHKHLKSLNVLDIGTGSGCIAISIAKNLPFANVYALDFSIDALEIAKKNAKINNVIVNFCEYNILSDKKFPLEQKFDIIISNPPYVTESEKLQMLKNVTEFEPKSALYVNDNNPLIFYKKILDICPYISNTYYTVYFEINEMFGKAIAELMESHGFNNIKIHKDFSNKDRFVFGDKI